ncbi:hypothetical protein [Thermomonospora echinospora]|nr:hypothetical protein [Thermomonospora echinospora]
MALYVRIMMCLRDGVAAWAAFTRARSADPRRGGDRGVEVFEWAGVLILVAGIIAGVYSIGLPEKAASAVDDWIGKILDTPAE